jgi:hypothetical protein
VLKLLKFLVSLGCLALFGWWAFTVPLGERTLVQHVRAIGQSRESRELVRGAKDKVTDLTKGISRDEAEGDDRDEAQEGEDSRTVAGRASANPARPAKSASKPGAASAARPGPAKPKAGAPAPGGRKPTT